ncbi:MAG: ribosomal protein [Actinomycetota bacterium]
MKIRKGDRVQVLAGKDRGKTGTVTYAYPARGKVVVDGLNIAKKHQKPTSQTNTGGIIEIDKPIDVSNVAVVSPKDGKPTRVGYQIVDGKKIRVCKRTGEEIK